MSDVDGHGGNYQTQCAFNLMWLTLAHPSEVVEAEWAEFDLDPALWRILAERMKKRKEHLIPLPRQAVALLRGIATEPRIDHARYISSWLKVLKNDNDKRAIFTAATKASEAANFLKSLAGADQTQLAA